MMLQKQSSLLLTVKAGKKIKYTLRLDDENWRIKDISKNMNEDSEKEVKTSIMALLGQYEALKYIDKSRVHKGKSLKNEENLDEASFQTKPYIFYLYDPSKQREEAGKMSKTAYATLFVHASITTFLILAYLKERKTSLQKTTKKH